LLDRFVTLRYVEKVDFKIAPTLHFNYQSVNPPKLAASFSLDAFDTGHGDAIADILAEANRT